MSFFKPFEPKKEELARERKARSRGSGPQHSYELFRVPLNSQCSRTDQQAGGEDAVEKLCQLMTQPVGGGSELFVSDRREEEKLPYRQSPYMKKEPICNFCKRNGETEAFYSSHFLKGPGGKVTCPVLRKYKCPMCGATGEHAHTIKYCPYNTERYSTVMTDRTQRKSCGCKIHHSCTNRTH